MKNIIDLRLENIINTGIDVRNSCITKGEIDKGFLAENLLDTISYIKEEIIKNSKINPEINYERELRNHLSSFSMSIQKILLIDEDCMGENEFGQTPEGILKYIHMSVLSTLTEKMNIFHSSLQYKALFLEKNSPQKTFFSHLENYLLRESATYPQKGSLKHLQQLEIHTLIKYITALKTNALEEFFQEWFSLPHTQKCLQDFLYTEENLKKCTTEIILFLYKNKIFPKKLFAFTTIPAEFSSLSSAQVA